MRPFKRMRTIYLITVPIIALLSLFFPQSVGDRILTFFLYLFLGISNWIYIFDELY